ncbi:MAG: DUF2125 domain-containing protein, partial [Pseudomonadota bacterium]
TLRGEDDGGIRLDWLEETVSGQKTTLTFSDSGVVFAEEDGTEVVVATMRLSEVFWTIEEDSDGLAHVANAQSIRFNFSEQDGDADGQLKLSDLTAAVDVDYGDSYVVQAIGSLASVELGLRDMEDAGDELSVVLSDIQLRQDSDIDADLLEKLENADEEFNSVEEVQAALSGASTSTYEVGEFAVRYESVENEVTSAELVTRNLEGRSDLDLNGTLLGISLEGTTDAVAGSIQSVPVNGTFELSNYDVAFDASIAREDLPEFVETIEAGGPEALSALAMRYEVEAGETSLSGSFEEDGVVGSVEFASGAASEIIAIDDGRLLFDVLTEGFEGTFAMSMLGDEAFAASLDKLELSFAMPLVPSEATGPDELGFVFKALQAKASEAVWALFDAESTIPRDPINLDIDIAGWGEMLGALEEGSDFNEVFRIDGARINSFALSGGGAEATASGETLLDLSGGVPRGDGAFSVSLKGVTDLVGRLANLGIVPPEANLGIRGVLGAFARPVGEDQYVSEIELLPDGQILTNGVPLPLGR